MKDSGIASILSTVLAVMATGSSTGSDNMVQPLLPTSPAKLMQLTASELAEQKTLASNGDCSAALKVARHFGFVVNDFNESVLWLRIAVRCPAVEPKAELAYLLLGRNLSLEIVKEIETLIVQIGETNPPLAEDVRKEVQAKLVKSVG